MKDFNAYGPDFPAFLAGVTRALWEGRGLDGPLERDIHPQVIFRDASAIGIGPASVGVDVLATLASVPDLQMLCEDVIWSGSAAVGWLGTQRALAQGRHDGDGVFGGPTNRVLRYRVMTDAYAKAQRISDIWQVRDTGAILRQIGQEPRSWAEARARSGDPEATPFRPAIDVPGPYTGSGNSDQWGLAFADLLGRVMQGAFSVIPEQYDRACQLDYPGGRTAHGPAAAEAFWLGLRAAFPSAVFSVHHRIGMEEPLLPPRAALRWSLHGRHDGWGPFGPPSGAEVHVMGISHAEFGPWGLRREWTLIDEAAVWMQIARTG